MLPASTRFAARSANVLGRVEIGRDHRACGPVHGPQHEDHGQRRKDPGEQFELRLREPAWRVGRPRRDDPLALAQSHAFAHP